VNREGIAFDYSSPAELFLAKSTKGSRTKYRRFATAAEAIRHAVEDLRTPKAFGAWLEVGDERFDSSARARTAGPSLRYGLRSSTAIPGLKK